MAAPDANWKALPFIAQRDLVIRVRDRERKHLLAYPNVLGVGIGMRYANDQRTRHQCVTVQVSSKGPQSGPDTLPPSLSAFWCAPGGRRRRVNVPVDVIVVPPPRLQSGGTECVARLVRANGQQAVPVTGAVCCLVRRGQFPGVHVLSCHHVVYLTLDHDNPIQGSYFLDLDGVSALGPPADPFDVSRTDAAIVPWPQAQPGAELVAGRRLRGWADSDARLPRRDSFLTIATPSSGDVPVRYSHLLPHTQSGYHGGNVAYRFPKVLLCEFSGAATTTQGDSGSPVLDGAGRLVGMHFAGNERYAFVLPTYEVITRFRPMLVPILRLL